MGINDFMGKHKFLGGERLARAIYEYMESDLTALEQCFLLDYLGLSINHEAKNAFRSANNVSRRTAHRSMRAKFPREWPPPAPD